MKHRLTPQVRGSMVLALAIAVPACDPGKAGSDPGGSAETGSLQAALTVGGARHDVTAIHYKVVAASGTCDDTAIAEATSPLEDEAIPGSVLPPGSGTHAGADGLFVLPPGDYRVCATPMSDTGPSRECAPTEGMATVLSEATTEIVLVSQCGAAANGGLDVVVALNDPPTVEGLEIAPSKFITQCETATITATATDPDGDAIAYSWELVGGAGTLSSDANVATFVPSGAGDATVRVTVTDVNGGSAGLSFPIHVSAADCGPPACEVFGTDSFGYVGCSRTEDVPSCDDISLTGSASAACGGDDCATTIPLPFVFDYYGTPRTNVDISSNGKLGFPSSGSFGNSCSLEPQTIAPFWDDLYPPAGGVVWYETLGSAPARRFVVQWNVPHYGGGTSRYDVRAVLFEGSNDIRFCYADTTVDNASNDHGASATAGIAGSADGLVYSCNTPQLTEGLVLEFAHPTGFATCSDGIQNQGETGVDCGGPCGACATCSDGIQNQGETGVDCGGPCGACGGGSVFTFTDTTADDVGPTALYDFFTGLGPVSASQYILFEINAGGGGGAWCADNADFYVNGYLSLSTSSGGLTSGSWDKYTRPIGGSWSGPDTTSYANTYGGSCDGQPYSWCSEWGVGGLYLGAMPGWGDSSNGPGESYSNNWSNSAGWTVTVAVGADRFSTCGF